MNLRIKKALFFKPYVFFVPFSTFIFLFLNVYLNEIFVIGFKVFNYDKLIIYPYLFFLFANSFLIALNLNLLIMRFKEIKEMSYGGTFVSTLGTFLAFLTGACPGCIAGVFPFVMGLIGSSFNLTSLPFYGVEFQFGSFILLLIGTSMLSKELVCKIK